MGLDAHNPWCSGDRHEGLPTKGHQHSHSPSPTSLYPSLVSAVPAREQDIGFPPRIFAGLWVHSSLQIRREPLSFFSQNPKASQGKGLPNASVFHRQAKV